MASATKGLKAYFILINQSLKLILIQLLEQLGCETTFSTIHLMQPQQRSSMSGENWEFKYRGALNIKSSPEFKDGSMNRECKRSH